MKLFLVACFVGAVLAAPFPEDDSGTVEFIVNGVPEGQALELGNILGIKVNEHVDGVLASSFDPLHPYTAVGIAEAAAAAAADVIASPIMIDNVVAPEPVVLPAPVLPTQELAPEPVVLPAPVLPVVIPQPVVLPAPAQPVVIPEPVVLPPPAVPVVIPEPVVLPSPAQPEVVVAEPVVLPAPAAPEVHLPEIVEQVPVPVPQIANGEVFNNGVVQVHFNTPEEPTMLSTLQSWFNMVINYFNGGVQTSQQIV